MYGLYVDRWVRKTSRELTNWHRPLGFMCAFMNGTYTSLTASNTTAALLLRTMCHPVLPMCSSVFSCSLVWSTFSCELFYQDLDILTWNVLVSNTHIIWWSFLPCLFFLYMVSWILSSLIHSFSSICFLSSLRWRLTNHLCLNLHHWTYHHKV